MIQGSNIKRRTDDMPVETLVESFQRYFSVSLALTPAQKSDVYKVRYRVYCEEFGYEPIDEFPDHEEFDQFDDNSLHCLISHKSTQLPAGCVRLVSTGDDNKGKLPLEIYCAESLNVGAMDKFDAKRHTISEVSRLAVDRSFRRRATESKTRFGGADSIDCSRRERRTFSLISVSAFLAVTALTELTGRTNAFAMMEPFLPKLLLRSGITMTKIGRDIDYHGNRAPYFTTTESAVMGMAPELKELYGAIYESIVKDYQIHLRQ